MNDPIQIIPLKEITTFCQRWKIVKLEVFGSALREDFDQNSDIDFLITFAPEAKVSLFDHIQMETELSELVGRAVDLVSRRAIERSANWIRRKEILSKAKEIYAA